MTTAQQPLPELPLIAELRAPPAWRTLDFISDLHLSPDTPRTFDAWAAYLDDTSADAVFILGDLFEVWVGDDARHEGFEARCASTLSHAAEKRPLFFMAGNRDFLVGQDMLDACDVRALADPTLLSALGQRLLLTHGDELCVTDTEYQQFRSVVRNARWQHGFLAQPLADRRRFARGLRDQSDERKRDGASPMLWADADFGVAIQWLQQADANTLIHGHTHRPATEDIGAGCVRHVLSDWDCDHAPMRAEVLRLSAAGLERISLADACQ